MNDFINLRRVTSALARMWWLVLLVTLGIGGAGYLYSQSQTPVYRATATLLVGQSIQSRDLNRSQIQTSQEVGLTFADLARRYPVLNGTVEALGLEVDWRLLRTKVDVELVRNTQLIEISASASSPESAEAIADEIAQQLILLSPTDALGREDIETQAFVQERLQSLRAKIENGEARLQELQSLDLSVEPSETILQSQTQIGELEELITKWESNYSSLLSSLTPANDSPNYLELIEPALAQSSPISPRTLLNTLVALYFGAILGTAIVLLFDFMDETVHTSEEVSSLLRVPFLGEIGRLKGDTKVARLLTEQDLYSRSAEEYRLIRSKLQIIDQKELGKGHSILFTSSDRQEGCSTAVANIGIAMARSGLRTVIVDADLRRPSQHELFGHENDRGLISLLCYPNLDVEGLLKPCKSAPKLRLLNTGILWNEKTGQRGLSLTPAELLNFDLFQEILTQLYEFADVVLIDSPPVTRFAEASVLAPGVDGVVMVLALERTQRRAVKQAMLNLTMAKANVYGFVTNQASGLSIRAGNVVKLLTERRTSTPEPASTPPLLPMREQPQDN